MDVARHYEAAFHSDLSLLGIRPAQAYPRASESIGLMLDLIGRLVERGHAYVGEDGSVFYDAASFPTYGALSGNRLDALRPGHRFEGAVDEAKRFHADWALWKRAGDRRQLVWDSPWGPGFPGWHIECSAMSVHFLGDVIDVHTGGIDLRFPHHEDERAQSDAAVGHEVVRHWVHGEHLLFEGRKMAKSSGNVVLLRDVVARGLDPLALRLAFLGTRYRTQVDLSWDAIAAADRQLTRWRDRVADWAEEPSRPVPAELAEVLLGCAARRPGHPARPAGPAPAGARRGSAGRREVRDVRVRRPGARPGPGPVGRPAAGRGRSGRPARRRGGAAGGARSDPGSQRLARVGPVAGRTGRARRPGHRHPGRPDLDPHPPLTHRPHPASGWIARSAARTTPTPCVEPGWGG